MMNTTNIPEYKISLPVQTEFILNPDGCGKTVFTQLNREGGVCLYKRSKISNPARHTAFEVIVLKLVKAGAKLPNGVLVESDYESYPRKKAFGITGFYIKTLEEATEKFNEMLVKQINKKLESDNLDDLDESDESTDEQYELPSGQFTVVQFATFNCLSPVKAQPVIHALLAQGSIKKVGEIKGVGRPSSVYSMVQ